LAFYPVCYSLCIKADGYFAQTGIEMKKGFLIVEVKPFMPGSFDFRPKKIPNQCRFWGTKRTAAARQYQLRKNHNKFHEDFTFSGYSEVKKWEGGIQMERVYFVFKGVAAIMAAGLIVSLGNLF